MKKKDLFIVIGFSLLIVGIFGAIMAHELKWGDFPEHIAWAEEYNAVGYFDLPHPLFAKLVVFIRTLLPANIVVHISKMAKQIYELKSYEISTWLLMVFSYLATAVILLKRMVSEWNKEKAGTPTWIAAIAVLMILLVGPIFIFTYPNRLYLGYFTANPYHNPTFILLRPFMLLVFFGVVDNLFLKWDWKKAVLMALAIMCATLAKPNFTITFIPAIGLMILFFHIKNLKKINWLYLIVPLGITSVIVLGSQFFITYLGRDSDQIVFAPFTAMLTYVSNVPMVLIFGLLSILFPLVISILYWKENSGRVSFQLVWLNFFIALLMCYFVGEIKKMDSLNFSWGALLAVFLLFVENVIIFGRELIRKGFSNSCKSWKIILPALLLLLHLGCGIIYFIRTITSVETLIG